MNYYFANYEPFVEYVFSELLCYSHLDTVNIVPTNIFLCITE